MEMGKVLKKIERGDVFRQDVRKKNMHTKNT